MQKQIKRAICVIVPLIIRKWSCLLLNRITWLTPEVRYWWTRELLKDFCQREPNEYHSFLWSHHLGYALTYDGIGRFGSQHIIPSRKLFFDDVICQLTAIKEDLSSKVTSVLEVGSSLGYQLQYLETEVFPAAQCLHGIDVDKKAIMDGTRILRNIGSKVVISCEDALQLDRFCNGRSYDVIFSTGVLMYLKKHEAQHVVNQMVEHCNYLLAISGLAHPDVDNGVLSESVIRADDGAYIHNFDEMVQAAGAVVLSRRWEGQYRVGNQSIYFIFAKKRDG